MSATGSSTFQLIINAALADYAKLTGIDLSETPFAEKIELANSSEAILELLQEREKSFKEYRDLNRRLITYLRPAVKVLHACSGILGEAVSLAHFSPAKAVFTSIDVLLAAASGVTSSYDALLELFECLEMFLKRLEIYVTIPHTPIMTDIIVNIMVELLSVLAMATKQIKQGRFKKFAKKLLGDSEIEAVLCKLDRLTQDEARMTVTQTLGVVHGLVGNMKVVMEDGKASTDSIRQDLVALHQVLNEMNKMKRDQLQWDVQHWLSPPDPSTNHNFVSKARHNGTAAWFLESHALTEWKASGSLFWIHGKPGAGKSTLLSAIIQDVEGMHVAGLATMAYYYFDFRDIKKQDCYGLLSSLVFQLSAESDSCYKILSHLYSDSTRGIRKPTISVLKKCVTDMLSLSGQAPIYIIVDGLDECPNFPGRPSARREVLELIDELVGLNLPNVHLCVASRPEMDIRMVLEPLTSLKISLHKESGQKNDIIEYIKSVVRSEWNMRRWKEEDKQLVVDTLSEKADGMFRWVVCQVDRLCRTLPASIQKVLNDLPKTLDETYRRTLLGIDEEKREYAQRLFQCLLVSIRPLRVEELAEILAVQFDEAGTPTFNPAWRPESAEESVTSVCSSLISIIDREDSQIVQFSHFSVKEFLTSERLASAEEHFSYYHIFPEHAHTILAHASLSVLLQFDDKIDRSTIAHFPLAPYAARHWVDHAEFGNVSFHIQEVMGRLFNPAKPHFAAWVWLYDVDRHWIEPMSNVHPTRPEAEPFYYAVLCGFRGLVEHVLAAHSPDVNSRGGSHTTPLHAAPFKRHLEVASLLLGNGADPNSRDDQGIVPLHTVSQSGHVISLEIARLLVNSGANVDLTDILGWTPLHTAARYGHRDVAELLLEFGARVDVPSITQETPLHLTCLSGVLDIARLLLDRGSDMNFRDKYGRISLHTASQNGHLDIVRLLLDCGSDVNVRSTDGLTPLHYASQSGHLYVAKLLVERGASVDNQNDDGETPLDHAAAFGHLDVAIFLIELGAAVSVRDNNGWTPYHTASKCGHLHIAKFLLECGIDVNVRDGSQRTSLYLSSSSGKLDVARFLIERGADIHAKDNTGWSSLHIASQNGHLDVVQMLIDAGIAVDIRNGTQMTPLALASRTGKADVGRFLIERGADINVRDNESRAPLHIASEHGHLDVARLLLDHGVDPGVQLGDLRSPLHLASVNGHLKIAELLVQRGAIVDIFNENQETPLFLAAMEGKLAISRLLIDHGANVHNADSNGWTVLHAASQGGHLEVVKLLLRRGADVNALNKASKTAADLASENNEAEVVKFIAEYKMDENVRNKTRSSTLDTALYGTDEDDGKDSLHIAAEEGTVYAVKSFLERGMDINSRNTHNQTPLDRAASKGNVDVVLLLVERGAEVDSRDKWGWTPLHRASQFGHLEVSRVLADHGANVNAKKRDHWTSIHLSAVNGHLGVVKLLLERGADALALNGDSQTAYQLSLASGTRKIAELLQEHGAGRVSS